MFIHINAEEYQAFRPLTLNITFDNADEFAALYHRLNAKRSRFEDYVEKYNLSENDAGVVRDSKGRVVIDFVRPLFRVLDELATERGYDLGETENGKSLPEGTRD